MDPNGLTQGRPGQPWGLCEKTNVPPPCTAVFGHPHTNWAYADNGMINAVYDFLPERRLTPFVGVGVGINPVGRMPVAVAEGVGEDDGVGVPKANVQVAATKRS